jgi:hypothetical protein
MSKVEREVDAIRDVIYAEIKDMTAKQQTEYFHARCEQAKKDYGFWQSKPTHVNPTAGGRGIYAESATRSIV